MRLIQRSNYFLKTSMLMVLFTAIACSATSTTETGATVEPQEFESTGTTSSTDTSKTATTSTQNHATTKTSRADTTATTSSFSQDGVFFPKQRGPQRGFPDARATGQLILTSNGCLRLKQFDDLRGDLPIWPPDYSLHTEGDHVRILDENGRFVAEVGDYLDMGGGIISLDVTAIPESLRRELPERCPPPYFMVGDEVDVVQE